MRVLTYEFTPQQPGVYNVKLNVETVYNYSFSSAFKITVLEQSGNNNAAESAVNLPAVIECKEGQTRQIFLAPATQDVISIYKLSGPGQIIQTPDGFIWSFTPDYNYIPYYMQVKEETLIIVSSELGRGNFVHSAVVRTENTVRQPTPNSLSIIVGEGQRFAILLEKLYNNPDNIPLAAFVLLDSSTGTLAGGLLNQILLNEIPLNVSETGASTSQAAYNQYLSVVDNMIVGSFPAGFVPRSNFYVDLKVDWAAVFLNGVVINGQLNITVVGRKTPLQGKQVSYTIQAGTVKYIKVSELFEYPTQSVIYYTAVSPNAELCEIDGDVYLKAYMPVSRFKFPTTSITESYILMARALDGQTAYSTVHVTFVHSFKPARFRGAPRFLVYNYSKARLRLTDFIDNQDGVPVVSAQVVQQGFKRLEGQEYYKDDRDKLLEIASAEHVLPSTFNLDSRWGKKLQIRL